MTERSAMRYEVSGNSQLCEEMKDYLVRKRQMVFGHEGSSFEEMIYKTKWGTFVYDSSKNSVSLENPDKKAKRKLIKLMRRFD